MMGLLCALCVPFFFSPIARHGPQAGNGVISFDGVTALDRPFELTGEWRFFWKSRLDDQAAGAVPAFPIHVPGVWEHSRTPAGAKLPAQGVARYQLTIRGLPAGRYRLYLPVLYAANRTFLNGALVSEQGHVGDSAATTRYNWRADDVSFEIRGGTDVTLAIDVAAFLHRDNGMESAPAIGLAAPMQSWFALRWAQEFLFQIALMLIGMFSLVVFLFRPTDKASLYIALSNFSFMPVSAMLGFDNILLVIFPWMSFPVMLMTVYVSTGISLCFFLANVHTLFPDESSRPVFRTLVIIIAAFFGLQAIAIPMFGTLLASQINSKLVLFLAFAFLYIMVVLVRAVRRHRDGAAPFLIGMGILFVSIIVLAIVAAGLLRRDQVAGINFATFGILALLFSHLVVIAERWSLTIAASEKTNSDLRQLLDVSSSITSEMGLEALLTRIVEVTSKILHAERSTLFLFDEKRDELWSLVAEGVVTKEIRIASTDGLAGDCFTRGEAVIVSDAYAEPHFNPVVDENTGFRTRNVISIPITTREGRKLGVMQALNRQQNRDFDPDDLSRMRAFGAQAAIALDNATLFSEVVSSRNYNESILRSMSSGVITLDRDARVAKLNAAACAILEVDEGTLDGANALAVLAEYNPWLVAEMGAEIESGSSKILLDIDIQTGSRSTKSVNVSIVPLVSEGERAGVLVLIEDISEGKRLQGAMRRFMPQKVVDQVLDRSDDLLFGSACQASVLFADIRGFTAMSEALTPRETVDMLNEVFTDLFEAVAAADGILDKYIGDAIMAVYGVPLPTGRDPLNAVESAVSMLKMIDTINTRRKSRKQVDLRLGIGISTGEVVAGTIGSPKRMDYTVIGDSVNLAARLQDTTKYYQAGIVICEETANAIGGAFPLRELDLIRVRGRVRPAKIFEVLTPVATADQSRRDAMLAEYGAGRAFLAQRDWAGAETAFEKALAVQPDDRPSAILRDRAGILRAKPPAGDWDGVWSSPGSVV
jgi:adenylate cyclase